MYKNGPQLWENLCERNFPKSDKLEKIGKGVENYIKQI
jgi:hypothetical protein